jgi:hypothetical protein
VIPDQPVGYPATMSDIRSSVGFTDDQLDRAGRIFGLPPNVVLPGQIQRRSNEHSPELSLWWSVMMQAIQDLRSRKATVHAAALAWFHSPDFDVVCEWLDLEPGRVRNAVLQRV